MSLCHLYSEQTSSLHVEQLKEVLEGVSLDINNIDIIDDYDVYIIELEQATKEISLKLRSLLKAKVNPLIYFIISAKHNLILFQLTYLLGTKDVITQGQDTNKIISKIISNIKSNNTNQELVIDEVYNLDLISSRISFLNLLEEKLEKQTKFINAITINIHNVNKIQKELGLVALEKYLNRTLLFMESLFEEKLIFSQYERNFYIVLLEDTDFEDIKEMANEFHHIVLDDIAHEEFKFMIDVFTVNFDDKTIDDAITIFNSIKNKELTFTQMHSESLEYTSQTQGVITEKSVLDEAYKKQVSFKLLNIYNGLVITTPSKILKKVDDNIYISFEQLQGVVMKMEKQTILQSGIFLQDILADIKVIDSKKKIAILENFGFLNTNANSRKYARVTTSRKIPISLAYIGITLNGNILDLSIKSIAIKSKYTKNVETIKYKIISISFNIPNYRFDNGYTQLKLNAKVIVVLPLDSDGNCKIVCDFEDGSDDESIIKEYVYDRQKELIIEIKKMSKLN